MQDPDPQTPTTKKITVLINHTVDLFLAQLHKKEHDFKILSKTVEESNKTQQQKTTTTIPPISHDRN